MELEVILKKSLENPYRIKRENEGILYHYTNLQALYAILSTGSIWMTRSEFLNDASELTYIKTVIEDVFSDKPASSIEATFKSEVNEILNGSYFNEQHRSKCYILSLTAISDLITNWSAYSNFDGYNIGLDSLQLHHLLEIKYGGAYMAGYVLYDESLQRKIVREEVERYLGIWEHVRMSNEAGREVARAFMVRMLNYSYFFKHPAFKPETEYRVAFFPENLAKVQEFAVLFRTSAGGLVPYIELDFKQNQNDVKLPVKEVWIGPTNKMDNAYLGLKAFLQSLGYMDTDIKKSVIPLRF
ncbi:DUF2971 domain-containing protein [Bacillus sp. EB01]|uniref:DUF2971 domain-containing protein n=1 Tax=Bacillus sp. EB01 TaxID=1347086 RepID=UPI0005C474C0|nr:DUF2971 domain-containing protein [Bacillus sp. EB01]